MMSSERRIVFYLFVLSVICLSTLLVSAQPPMTPEQLKIENERRTRENALVEAAYKDGNAAYAAGHLDEAIAHFDEGLNGAPGHPGAYSLLINKSYALRARGAVKYNAALGQGEAAAQANGIDAARKDFRASVDAATRAVELLKAVPVPKDPAGAAQYHEAEVAALEARARALVIFVERVDPNGMNDAIPAWEAYLAAETDSRKSADGHLKFGKLLLDTGEGAKAYNEYKKVLAVEPNNVDALAGAGMSLVELDDKTKIPEARRFFAKYLSLAPADHPLRKTIEATMPFLK